jgi:thiol-disulfide isomerase/thioredoxin
MAGTRRLHAGEIGRSWRKAGRPSEREEISLIQSNVRGRDPFATLSPCRHHCCMLRRTCVVLLAAVPLAIAGILDDVRSSIENNNLPAAESELQSYRGRHGADPEYLEALSWMARATFARKQLDRAEQFAKETESLSKQQLASRSLDREPHLPIALGAALEVEAQVLAARGQQAQAVALLRRGLTSYGSTSIRARLQKNLNLLGLTSQPAPPLSVAQHLGPKPVPLAQLKGSPVLLFFWAHWCGDCKAEGPIISQLRSEFGPKGLMVVAPTQLYGYAAEGEDATPKTELGYIERVWQHFYPGLQSVPVPVSKANFNAYGASTTPTLVLLDRVGRGALSHPGVMPYADLRSAVERILN